MDGGDRSGGEIFQSEIPRRDRIEGVAHRPRETQFLRGCLTIDGERSSCERRRTQWAFVETFLRVLETAAVAREHFDIGKAMMCKGDGLGRLKMGEAWHDGGRVRARLQKKHFLQGYEPAA